MESTPFSLPARPNGSFAGITFQPAGESEETYDTPLHVASDAAVPTDFGLLLGATEVDGEDDAPPPPRPPKPGQAVAPTTASAAWAPSAVAEECPPPIPSKSSQRHGDDLVEASRHSSVSWAGPVELTHAVLVEQAQKSDAYAGNLSREETVECLEGFADGTYLLRYSEKSNKVVLSFKQTTGKMLHFQLDVQGGALLLDGKPVAGACDVDTLLAILRQEERYLGVTLTFPASHQYAEKYVAASSEAAWYRGAMSRPKAEAVLGGQPDGTFLVRKRDGSSFAVSLAHGGTVSHHLLEVRDGGLPVLVNNQERLAATTLGDAIAELQASRGPKLPCALGQPAPL
jgi:hypothetical protein